jgi:isocitrate dehydrogenase (NAD+)
MSYQITLLPGDGIGPEITAATVKVLEATGISFDWDRRLGGVSALEATGDPLPEATLESIRRTRLALKGPLTTPVGEGFRSVNVALRREFELYANVRPALTILPGGRFDGVDIVMIRENLEGLYSGVEHWIERDGDPRAQAEAVAVVTRKGAEKVIRYAYEYALSGLFLEVGREFAREYEGRISSNELIIDNCAMQLVMRPEQFDVMVTTNLFGDIISDLMAGLVGGLGLTPGGNIGTKAAIFEAVHGSAPDIAGQGIANPSAMILAGAMMLDHLGESDAADHVRRAIVATLVADHVRTRDLGGTATTQEFGDAVAHRVA